MPQMIGTKGGQTYFTFRIGPLWGVVLDCGEDKVDTHEAYGGLVDCHDMRLAETLFLQNVISHAEQEYLAPGVEIRICLTHIPLPSRVMDEEEVVFNIEQDIYAQWTQLLNQMQLDLMLCGHMHKLRVDTPEKGGLRFHAQFPVTVCAEPRFSRGDIIPVEGEQSHYWAGALEIKGNYLSVQTVDDHGCSMMLYNELPVMNQ